MGFTHPTLRTDDELSDSEMRQSVRGLRLTTDDLQYDYDSKPASRLYLSELKRMYETKDTRRALMSLGRVRFIKIDEEFKYPNDHPDLAWGMEEVRSCGGSRGLF